MKRRWLRRLCLTFLLLAVCGLAGCKAKERIADPEAGIYRIYYLNQTRTKLASVEYVTESREQEKLVKELYEQLLAVPENPDYQAVLGGRAVLLHV